MSDTSTTTTTTHEPASGPLKHVVAEETPAREVSETTTRETHVEQAPATEVTTTETERRETPAR